MTNSQTNNKVFKGNWELRRAFRQWRVFVDGKLVITFDPDTPDRIIRQIFSFCQIGYNLEINYFIPDIPRVFITVSQETLSQFTIGETVAIVEVTRLNDDHVARFSTSVQGFGDGSVSASIRSGLATAETRDVAGCFVNYAIASTDVTREVFGTFVDYT